MYITCLPVRNVNVQCRTHISPMENRRRHVSFESTPWIIYSMPQGVSRGVISFIFWASVPFRCSSLLLFCTVNLWHATTKCSVSTLWSNWTWSEKIEIVYKIHLECFSDWIVNSVDPDQTTWIRSWWTLFTMTISSILSWCVTVFTNVEALISQKSSTQIELSLLNLSSIDTPLLWGQTVKIQMPSDQDLNCSLFDSLGYKMCRLIWIYTGRTCVKMRINGRKG
jgi:hypothetical protein